MGEHVDQHPAGVRQAFQFCLAVAMEEDGQVRLINRLRWMGGCGIATSRWLARCFRWSVLWLMRRGSVEKVRVGESDGCSRARGGGG